MSTIEGANFQKASGAPVGMREMLAKGESELEGALARLTTLADTLCGSAPREAQSDASPSKTCIAEEIEDAAVAMHRIAGRLHNEVQRIESRFT